ncbi:MAG: lysophospholipid acyltransferase family protein [Dehalococcoidia bacterium]
MLLYSAFIIGTTLARVVPLRLSYALARGIGLATYYAWRGGRRRCIQNHRHVTGGDEAAARRHARASFANYLVYLVDFFRLLGTAPDALRERVRSEDWARVAAERRGRGIVAMTLHYGNWDIAAALFAQHGMGVTAVADRFPNARVNDFVVGSRRHLGLTVVPADRPGPALLRALHRDDVVALLIDIPTAEGVPVTFFGDTIRVSDGPARLALRSGANVVAGVTVREEPWSDRVRAEAQTVAFTPTGDAEADARALMQAVFTHLEALVRRDPAQWYIFRNLWPSDAAGAVR